MKYCLNTTTFVPFEDPEQADQNWDFLEGLLWLAVVSLNLKALGSMADNAGMCCNSELVAKQKNKEAYLIWYKVPGLAMAGADSAAPKPLKPTC